MSTPSLRRWWARTGEATPSALPLRASTPSDSEQTNDHILSSSLLGIKLGGAGKIGGENDKFYFKDDILGDAEN